MTEPLTQAQDHDRRIGRLEGIAEQLVEQGRQTNARLDSIERSLSEVRKEIAAGNKAINSRIDNLFYWIIGILVAILAAVGSTLFKLFW